MQKQIEENITVIKDNTVPLKKKIRKYTESVELLDKYKEVITKLGSIKTRKTMPEVSINNIDELMTKSQEILQSFDDGEITLDKMEKLVELKKILLCLQKFVKEKKIDTFVIRSNNMITKAHLEDKILILSEEEKK